MVVHRASKFKQLAFETAVRNPERYLSILNAISEFNYFKLNDENLLIIVTKLYREGIFKTNEISTNDFAMLPVESQQALVKNVNRTRRADGGFPSGYASRFWTYMRTPSEFGLVRVEYNEKLELSDLCKLFIKGKLDNQIVFLTSSVLYNRKSPFRNVSNDFNFFKFIVEVLISNEIKDKGISYEQLTIAMFSKNGNVEEFLELIRENHFPNSDSVYLYAKNKLQALNTKGTITRDYPDVVLRLLTITGIISIKYLSRGLRIYINSDNFELITTLFKNDYKKTDKEKTDKLEFFKNYNKNAIKVLEISSNWIIDTPENSAAKLQSIVDTYEIGLDDISLMLKDLNENRDKKFKYINDPLKLEFYISLLLFIAYGDKYKIEPKYKTDSFGIPISHAPGGIGDIYVFSDQINWLIEVTLIKNKQQQYNSETSSVIRHMKNDEREGYISFVAPIVHEDTKTFYDIRLIQQFVEYKKINLKTYNILEFVHVTKRLENLEDMQKHFSSTMDIYKERLF